MPDAMIRGLTHPFTLLFIGGGIGANLRYWLGVGFASRGWTASFPWHTFAINVFGSFALGFIAAIWKDNPPLRLFLGAGLCGGFTTFSTFSLETVDLLETGRPVAAIGYVLGSIIAAVGGAWLGLITGRA